MKKSSRDGKEGSYKFGYTYERQEKQTRIFGPGTTATSCKYFSRRQLSDSPECDWLMTRHVEVESSFWLFLFCCFRCRRSQVPGEERESLDKVWPGARVPTQEIRQTKRMRDETKLSGIRRNYICQPFFSGLFVRKRQRRRRVRSSFLALESIT